MLKRIVKKVLRKTLLDLRSQANGRGAGAEGGFVYDRLNALLLELMAQGKQLLRPSYTWGVLQAAHLAAALRVEQISVIELGVAGGNGLYALEWAAEEVSRILDVRIDVYGFDIGTGLPRSTDYRDQPNLYTEGSFRMDPDLLRRHLKRAELVLGPVQETVPEHIKRSPAPLGFVSVDLDYYSSTIQAFRLFEADYERLLPRVHCYFDDILGFTCSEFTGERLAISEFNRAHSMRKISPIFGLKYWLPRRYRDAAWAEKFYLAHFFDHPLYGLPDGLVRTRVHERSTDFALQGHN
jgi:hypothetical protein